MPASHPHRRLAAVPFALAMVIAGCGNDTIVTAAPSEAPSNEGGFGAPAASLGEFGRLSGIDMVGSARLESNGCWYLAGNGDAALLVAPAGTQIGDDGRSLITGAGTVIEDGAAVDSTGGFVALDQIPGGPDGKWGNYASFCNPTYGFVAVTETLDLAFDPTGVDPAALIGQLDASVFDTDFGCGYGFMTGAADERWSLIINVTSGTPPEAGVVVLPDDRFDVTVTAGAHLFANNCDDVMEWFEPVYTPAVDWNVTGGTFTYPGGSEATCGSGLPVTITLVDATVDTGGDPIVLAPIDITNDHFGCFAG